MQDQYLLYIDILGFSDLARDQPDLVDDLYRRIASLNAHKHPDFATIVFSDTVLVHCPVTLRTGHGHSHVVMYMCEFAQDLMHRLAGRNIAFRSVLTFGAFEHYHLNAVPCFFGPALIRAYKAEKAIKATGLYIDNESNRFNHIFSTARLDDDWSFVFLTQHMNEWEDTWQGRVPLDDLTAIETDVLWFLGPEILHLEQIYRHAQSHSVEAVRLKYQRTWEFYTARYPQATSTLVGTDFKLEAINRTFPWDKLRERVATENYLWASTKVMVVPKP